MNSIFIFLENINEYFLFTSIYPRIVPGTIINKKNRFGLNAALHSNIENNFFLLKCFA